MDQLPGWFSKVREQSVPYKDGRLYRWDASDGNTQFGVDAFATDETIDSRRLAASLQLEQWMNEHGVDVAKLTTLPAWN